MQNIIPISHMKNYSKVIRKVKKNRPVYLTRNGIPCNALLDIEEYEELLGCREYLLEVIGEILEANGRLNETDKTNDDEKEMSEIISEYMREVYDNEFNPNRIQTEEVNDITRIKLIPETQELILKSISGIYDILWLITCNLYEIDEDALKKLIKEHSIWK